MSEQNRTPAEIARTRPAFSLADERDARLKRIKAQIDAGEWGVPSETLADVLIAAEEQGLLCDCEAVSDIPNTPESRELARNIQRALDYRERREAYDADPPGYPASFAEQVKRDHRAERILNILVAWGAFLLFCGALGAIIYGIIGAKTP